MPGQWLLKPRTNASAIGIKRIETADELWPVLDQLGDLQSHYVLERFMPGEIFYVEGVTWEGKTLFGAAYQYGRPPFETMHQGGVFSTRGLDRESSDARELLRMQGRVLEALGLVSVVTHTEFIKSQADGEFYFLETAARVGGAHIAVVVEFASGINPWWSGRGWSARRCSEASMRAGGAGPVCGERDLPGATGVPRHEGVRRS